MLQRFLNRSGSNLMEHDAAGGFVIQSQDMSQMPADSFSFPVRVSCQINFVRLGSLCL